jgi:hypothetical protein
MTPLLTPFLREIFFANLRRNFSRLLVLFELNMMSQRMLKKTGHRDKGSPIEISAQVSKKPKDTALIIYQAEIGRNMNIELNSITVLFDLLKLS